MTCRSSVRRAPAPPHTGRDLVRAIRTEIRRRASPRHVPVAIAQAPAVPRTISARRWSWLWPPCCKAAPRRIGTPWQTPTPWTGSPPGAHRAGPRRQRVISADRCSSAPLEHVHVVHVALAQAVRRDAHELGIALHRRHIWTAGVAHGRAHAADQHVEDFPTGPRRVRARPHPQAPTAGHGQGSALRSWK